MLSREADLVNIDVSVVYIADDGTAMIATTTVTCVAVLHCVYISMATATMATALEMTLVWLIAFSMGPTRKVLATKALGVRKC